MSGGGLPVHRSGPGWVSGCVLGPISNGLRGLSPGTDTGAALRDRPSSSKLATSGAPPPPSLPRKEGAGAAEGNGQAGCPMLSPWGREGYAGSLVPMVPVTSKAETA